MLSSVKTTLSVKEGKYLSSNNSFYDLTDHRGQGYRTINTWDSFIARLVNMNNSSSLPRFWDNSMEKLVRKKSGKTQGLARKHS